MLMQQIPFCICTCYGPPTDPHSFPGPRRSVARVCVLLLCLSCHEARCRATDGIATIRGWKRYFEASQRANLYCTRERRWFGKLKTAQEHAQALNL
jgi:hypothetical protein